MGTLHEGGTVGAMLITAIQRYADRPAIADNHTRWTYRELGDAAGRLVALFRTLGLRKGDGVPLLATNRVETWAVVTAAAVMGSDIRRCTRSPRRMTRRLSSRTPTSTR